MKKILFLISIASITLISCDMPLKEIKYNSPYDRGGTSYKNVNATFSPTDGSINASSNTPIVITFDRAVVQTGWTVTIHGTPYSSGTFDITGKILTIQPTGFLPRDTTVTVELKDFICSEAGYIAELRVNTKFTFKVKSGPTAVITPANAAANITPDSNLVIAFSEAMNQANSWSVSAGGTLYDKNSSGISWSGNTLTINPPGTFARSANVAVSLTGFTASLDNAAFAGTPSLSFTTIAPPGATFNPANGASNLGTGADITIYFTEATNQTNSWSINVNGTVFDKNSTSTSWSGNNLTVNPSFTYGRSSSVSVTLSGFTAALDGAAYAGSTTLSFGTTGAPTATFSPLNGVTGVNPDSNIVVTFSESMNQSNSWSVNVGGTVYDKNSTTTSWSGNALTINPTGTFGRSASVSVSLSGFAAVVDNASYGGTTSFSFTVLALPTVTFSPVNGTIDVFPETNIVLTFSEAMNTGNSWNVTVNSAVYDKNSTTTTSWSGNALTINPTTDFTVKLVNVSLTGFAALSDSAAITGSSTISFITILTPIADTGQTTSYTATFGEDHDYVDVPNARSFTGPTQHGTYTSDYTTRDNVTGLIWKTCSEGQSGADCGTGTATTYTWANAVTACTNLNSVNSSNGYYGRKDWRLPMIEELNTLPDSGTINPAINLMYFPGTITSFYWSSSTYVNATSYAWSVKFNAGYVYDSIKTSNYYVRCVSGP